MRILVIFIFCLIFISSISNASVHIEVDELGEVASVYTNYAAYSNVLKGTYNRTDPSQLLDHCSRVVSDLTNLLGPVSGQIFNIGTGVGSLILNRVTSDPSTNVYTAEPDIQFVSLYKEQSSQITNADHSKIMFGGPYFLLSTLVSRGRQFNIIWQDMFDGDTAAESDITTPGGLVSLLSSSLYTTSSDSLIIRHFDGSIISSIQIDSYASSYKSGLFGSAIILSTTDLHKFLVTRQQGVTCSDVASVLSQDSTLSCIDVV